MVEAPDMDTAVFARAVKDMEEAVEVPGTSIRLALGRGEIVITRWSAVRDLVLKGTCELV